MVLLPSPGSFLLRRSPVRWRQNHLRGAMEVALRIANSQSGSRPSAVPEHQPQIGRILRHPGTPARSPQIHRPPVAWIISHHPDPEPAPTSAPVRQPGRSSIPPPPVECPRSVFRIRIVTRSSRSGSCPRTRKPLGSSTPVTAKHIVPKHRSFPGGTTSVPCRSETPTKTTTYPTQIAIKAPAPRRKRALSPRCRAITRPIAPIPVHSTNPQQHQSAQPLTHPSSWHPGC